MNTIAGHIVDVVARQIKKGILYIDGGKIVNFEASEAVPDQYIIPGFVDAHIHIESSMMLPSEFARYSLPCGTVACVCDPHEIANVCGIPGVNYMIENGKKVPLKYYFGAPSCVPATPFDSSGAILDAEAVSKLLERDDIYFLAEMMNYPGVIEQDEQVHLKLRAAHKHLKPIDGHAPELTGEGLIAYASAGITTDHECMTIAEAEAKIALGMKVLIREGSAAKNFDDLLPLLEKYNDEIMFCSDDKHPDDLMKNGHINTLARRAVAAGMNDLLRPSLYGAWMNIIEVDSRTTHEKALYDVVGPVCETGDFLGKERTLAIAEGSLLAVRSAGAYGFTMSSNYNTRPRAAEVLVDGDQAHLIREREQLADLWRETIQAPCALSGVHFLPKSGHCTGDIAPVKTDAQLQPGGI